MKVVISQPMFFPWVGMLEQIRLADVFIYYDDVQFSKGSFTNRVQIKTPNGVKWLTAPVHIKFGQNINEVIIDTQRNWRASHLSLLKQAYAASTFTSEMIEIVEEVYQHSFNTISELSIASMEALCRYYSIGTQTQFFKSSELNVKGHSSQRVLDIVKHFSGDVYVTGHGAMNYLDHESFEDSNIRVEYIDYQKVSYEQCGGDFTPFVSTLDLIANLGKKGEAIICSETLYWKDFLKKNAQE